MLTTTLVINRRKVIQKNRIDKQVAKKRKKKGSNFSFFCDFDFLLHDYYGFYKILSE